MKRIQFKKVLEPSALVILGGILYAWSVTFDFTYFDDNALILNNIAFLQNWGNLFRVFKEDVFSVLNSVSAYYRPLLTLSFMTDASIGGSAPWIYHLTNILVHLVNTLLFFSLLKRFSLTKALSIALSIVFLIHPANVAAVSWVPGRNDTLLTLFVLVSTLNFLSFLKTKSWLAYSSHLLFFIAALLTKETAIMMVVLLAGFALILDKPNSKTRRIKSLLPALPAIIAWAIILPSWWIVRSKALGDATLALDAETIVLALTYNSPALLQNFGKAFLPFNLSTFPFIKDTTLLYGGISLIGFFALVWRQWRAPLFQLGCLWFLIFSIPPLVYANPNGESRLYLPLMGVLISLIPTLQVFTEDFAPQIKPIFKGLLAAGLLGGLALLNLQHQAHFQNKMTFWENAVANAPHAPLAQRNLGAMYYLNGDLEKAERHFHLALAENPMEPMAHNNLGLIYMNKNQLAAAEMEYLKELAINPTWDDAHYNLALVYIRANQAQRAYDLLKRTIEINPEHKGAQELLSKFTKE